MFPHDSSPISSHSLAVSPKKFPDFSQKSVMVTAGPWFPPHSNASKVLPLSDCPGSEQNREKLPPKAQFVLKAFALNASQLLCNKKRIPFSASIFFTNPHEEPVIPDLGSVAASGWYRGNERLSGSWQSLTMMCAHGEAGLGRPMAFHYAQSSHARCGAKQRGCS